MSDVVDTNVVEIRFDNSQFVENVSQTIDSVEALKKSLQFDSSSFDSLNRYASSVDLSNIATNIESLSERFSNFGIIGMTALQRITNEVMTLGGKLVGLLAKPWQQIISGGTKRATNIANAQFQLEGIFGKSELGAAKLAMTMNADAEAIKTITGYTEDMVVAMDAANYAVADTAYGLDSAAKAASVLATSGVDVLNFQEDLKDSSGMLRTEMQVALRSISGVAAMANSSYDEIAHVFERISGNGRIMAIDLQSLSARGLNAAATLRDYLNEIGETSNATEADIREMVSKGKIDFMTFAKAMDSAYGDHAKDANNTFEGAFSNMKFALSKIGADFISPLREKMIPILNDVRMVINSIRKALSFKIKFPWTDEEVSIIELFTRAVTNLTNKAHEFFMMWTGGQTVLEKAMTGFSEVTGSAFSDVKKIFDEVKEGTRSSSGSILELIHMAESSGSSMDEVFKTLAETLNTTEDDIRRMCQNGEISFEQFSNAISATFGNTVWDKRVKQLATVFRNLLSVVYNIASTITSILGPAIEAFMNVFAGKGINGVIGFTNSMADLTSKLRLSVPAQRALVKIFESIFRVLKLGLGIVKDLGISIIKILFSLSPLIDAGLNIISVLAAIVSAIVSAIASSEIFTRIIRVLTAALIIAGRIIVAVLLTIISMVAPAIQIVSNVFSNLNKSLKSVDTRSIGRITSNIKALKNAIGNGQFVQIIQRVISTFVYSVGIFFVTIAYVFTHLGEVMTGVKEKIKEIIKSLIENFKDIGTGIKDTCVAVANYIKKNFSTVASVLAAVESILALSILYRIVHFGSAINKALSAWANKQNAEAFALAIRSIRQLAASFILLAVAAFILAAIPTDRILQAVGGMMALTLAIIGLAMAIKWVVTSFAELNKTKEKIDPLRKSMANFVNGLNVSMTRLSKGIQSFLKNIGRTGAFIALAALILSIAGAMFILFFAVKQWATLDHDTVVTGLTRIGIVLASLTVACSILGAACKKAGGGLMGAAVLMLALSIALKQFAEVIALYDSINYGWKEWAKNIIKISASLFVMAGAVALMGAACKKSGFGMIAGAIDMLAFLVVLHYMTSIIDEYSKINFLTVIGSMIKMAAVLVIFCGAIALMSDALTSERGFSASLRGGINYKKTGQNFMGLILMLLSMAILMKTVASSIINIKTGGFFAWFGLIILIRTVFGYLIDLVDTIGNRKINGKALIGITAMLFSISLIFSIMSLLDPFTILTIAGGVSLVLATLSLVIERLVDLSAKINKKKGKSGVGVIIAILLTLTAVIAVVAHLEWQSALAGATGMSMILLSISATFKLMDKVKIPDKKIAAKMLQVMLAVLGVLAIMSMLPVRDVKSLMALTTSMAVISVVIGFVARLLGNAKKIDKSALGAFAAVGGTIGVMVLMFAGAAAIAAGKESAFAGLTLCITALSFVAVAIMKLLTLINTNAKVWASFGLFASIMGVITGFAALISLIAQIGDTSNTVTIMSSLVRTMYGLLPVIAGIQLVISVFALLLQNPMVMVGAAVGLGLFAGIMLIITGFVALISLIAQIGDTSRTVTIMESVAEMMRSLTITLLLVVAVGALGLLAIAGLGIIIAAVSSILLLCGIIGGFETIRNAVMTGVTLILTVCNAIREVTEIMANLSLEGIMIFITALDLLSSINIAGLARLGLVGATLLVATTPIMIIGSKKKDIKKGLDISKQMMTDLLDIYAMSKILSNMDADSIIAATKDTLKIADAMIDFSSLYIVSGLAHGLVDSRSRDILKMGAIGMAAIIDTEFRDIMGIHSDSDWGIDKAHWTSSGIGHGMIDPQSVTNLIGGVDGMADIIDAEGTKEFAKAGISNGATYVSSFLNFVSQAGGSTAGVEQGLNTLFGSLTDSSKVKKSIKSEFDTYYTAFRTQQIQFDRNAKDYQRNHAGYYSPNLAGPDVSQVKDAMSEFTDYGDLSSFFSSLDDMMNNLTSVNDLMNGIDGLGSSAYGASRSVDELTSKIDSLMDKYEDLWDDAKDRANKDLFKGVDKQGDDFLDSIQEIMDKYKNIYHDAVEKTNSEDLFAEVKDEEESFAPETLLNNLEDQVNQVNELNTIISSLGGRIADNGLRAAISSMSVDDLPELRAMYRMDDKQLRSYEQMYQKKVQANQNKIQNELTGSLSQITGQYTNVATYVATDASTNALIHNLQSQIDQLNDYNNTVASLTTRIKDVNLREAIAHMGVESLDELKALNAMTDKQLDEYTAMYNTKISEEARTIKQELSTELSTLLGEPVDISEFYLNYRGAIDGVVGDVTEKAGETAGDRIGTGMATGMSGPNVVATATNSGRDLTAATAEGISDEESVAKVTESTTTIVDKIIEILQDPKNDFKESGLKIVDEIIRGLIRGRDSRDFYDTIHSIGDAVKTRLDEKADLFVTCGKMIDMGLARGVRDNSGVVEASVTAVVAKVIRAAKQTAKINSPSRVFMQMGRFMDEGLAIGLRNYSSLASDEAGEMAEGSISAVQDAIQQLSGMLDGSIDINPVITPTLDLSEVNARSAALANMFNGRQIAVQARADDQQAEMITQLGNILAEQNSEPRSIVFNQTNNSPKALSRTEIYRQTRNGFSQLASAIQ